MGRQRPPTESNGHSLPCQSARLEAIEEHRAPVVLLMMITAGSTSLNVKGSRGLLYLCLAKSGVHARKRKNCHEICNSVPLTFSPAPRIKHGSARKTGKK